MGMVENVTFLASSFFTRESAGDSVLGAEKIKTLDVRMLIS
jgi:hypothetical protein